MKLNFPNASKKFQFDNALEYTQHAFQAILHLYGTIHHLTYLSISQKNGRAKRTFVIFLTLLVLSFSLPKFLPLFKVKLLFTLFMLLIAFSALSFKIKLHISVFLGHLLTITTFAPSTLPVSFFFNLMNITNLSLNLGFVLPWLWWKSKGVSMLWSYLSSSLYLSKCWLLGTSLLFWALSLLLLHVYLLYLRTLSRQAAYSFHSLDFTDHPLVIFYASPGHHLMNRWKTNKSKTSYPTLCLGPLLLLCLEIMHKTFYLVTQLG